MEPYGRSGAHGSEAGYRAAAADLAARLAERAAHNTDNVTRTAFYLAYWRANPEVMWSLLGHLVSRNVGYQMSDLRRHIERLELGRRWLSLLQGSGLPTPALEHQLGQLFRFLEAGNFLIFHDAYPQLVAYAAAKRAYLATGCASAVLVLDDLAAEGVDPTILAVWRWFFEEAARCGFFGAMSESERRCAPAVVRMALACVVNEQSYLEDRLLAPAANAPRFVDAMVPFSLWFEAAAALELTRLVFAVSAPEAPARAARLLVHLLGTAGVRSYPGAPVSLSPLLGGAPRPSFRVLSARIDVGRALYFGLFMADPERAAGVTRWAMLGPAHSGERSAYDPASYAPSSRRPGLLSRALPRGALPGWPDAPSPALPAWSTRFAQAVWNLEPIRADPFAAPAGQDIPIDAKRPLVEVVDPLRLLLG